MAVLDAARPRGLCLARRVSSWAIFVCVLLILTTLFTTQAQAAPTQPSNLTATAGDGQVALSWTAPNSDGGSPITHYSYAYLSTAGNKVLTSTGSTSTSYTITGLTNGVLYTIRIGAVNADGVSTTISTTATPTIAAPTGLTATAGDGQVRLSWTAPSPAVSTITKYQYTTDDGTTWTDAGATSPYTVKSLTNGTSYTFKVRAFGAGGGGTASASRSATPQAGTQFPPPPQQVESSPVETEPATEQTPPKRRIRYECPVGWTRGSVFGKTKKALIYELKVKADTTNTTSIYQLKSIAIYVHPDEGLETLDGWTLKVGTLYNQFGKEFKLTAENSVIDEHDFAHIENPEGTPIPMGTLGYIGQSLPSFDYRLYDATGVRVDFGISCYKAGGLTYRLWNTKDPRVLRVLPLEKSEAALSVQMQNLDWNTPFFRSEWTAAIMPDLPAAPAAPSLIKKNIVGTWADLKKQ